MKDNNKPEENDGKLRWHEKVEFQDSIEELIKFRSLGSLPKKGTHLYAELRGEIEMVGELIVYKDNELKDKDFFDNEYHRLKESLQYKNRISRYFQ